MLGESDRLDVIPDGIMAKCPSKYEPGKAGTPGAALPKSGLDPAAARQL
jgi:hypothetical protein